MLKTAVRSSPNYNLNFSGLFEIQANKTNEKLHRKILCYLKSNIAFMTSFVFSHTSYLLVIKERKMRENKRFQRQLIIVVVGNKIGVYMASTSRFGKIVSI